jgi:RND family efflux transporter MFP subunit
MKKNIKKNKLNIQTAKYILATLIVVIVGIFTVTIFANAYKTPKTETTNIQTVGSEILASGSTDVQTKATLNFQTGGKLTYLSVKEGDTVYQGQTIATLDTFALQKQLQIMANNYQIAKNSANQAQEGQQAGVLEGQQRTALDQTNKQGYSAVPETQLIYDNIKRIVDNATLTQNNAQIGIDIANYSIQLAGLTSPINGVVMHEDVTTSGVNITPVTSFVIADPASMIFAANVRQQDIDFISVGNRAKITIDGKAGLVITGIVDKIYPQRVILPTGESVYRVDIKADGLNQNTALVGQAGTVLIKSNFSEKVMLVPSWAVLSENFVWVLENNKPVLKEVTVGETTNGQTEILKGLSQTDKVITNPESIISKRYQII